MVDHGDTQALDVCTVHRYVYYCSIVLYRTALHCTIIDCTVIGTNKLPTKLASAVTVSRVFNPRDPPVLPNQHRQTAELFQLSSWCDRNQGSAAKQFDEASLPASAPPGYSAAAPIQLDARTTNGT